MRLTTIGRRTGLERCVIVGYFEDGPNLITMAMNGWHQGEPAWWLNLQACPEASVDLVDGPRRIRARAARGEERERLWSRWREIDENLDAYAGRRSAETAVVIMEPLPSRHEVHGPGAPDFHPLHRRAQAGGTLVALAGVFIVMGILTAETQYPNPPGYHAYSNDISDLGGTVPPHSFITQPAAHIFDWTMIVTGVMVIVGTICIHEIHRRKVLTIPTLLLGIGILGVGVFPGNVAVLHPVFALTAFLFGALAAIASYLVLRPPFRYLALTLGVTSLFFLVAGSSLLKGTLGTGGVERWIAYPVLMWMVLYGGHVLGLAQQMPRLSSGFEQPNPRDTRQGTPVRP